MTLKWLGHACFKLSTAGYSVVVDPFTPGNVPGYSDIREQADTVYCSHDHHDHNFESAVTIVPGGGSVMSVTEISSWHDDAQGAKRGANIIRVFESGGVRVAHLGDLGCPLDEDQLQRLGRLDAALIPVGGTYTLDAAQAAQQARRISAAVTIPMHYRIGKYGYDVIGTVEEFTRHFPAELVKHYGTDTIEIGKSVTAHIAVLTYKG